jgi:hypothetical protein
MGPWIFTNAGATGRLGPTQAQIDANYSGTSLEGAVTINSTHQGIQEWAVPASGTYRIEAWGAQGGLALQNEVVGKGAKMSGSFALSNETVLKIIVGQMPSNLNALAGGAGGGGSYIVDLSQNPLLIAGGGGGVPNYPSTSLFDIDAIITNDGGTYVAQGRSSASGAGGSFSASNTFTNSGESFLDGGKGGLAVYEGSDGGFGGGGGSSSSNALGAGGGGYSGGSETGSGGAYQGNQGGGGSYNAGTNQDNQAGVNEGHGKVIITYIGN